MDTDRPLFLPLKREYFDAFERGHKIVEYRKYGPRWNERTCVVGRAVTLSCGYGKARRLQGRIVWFGRARGPRGFGSVTATAVMDVFGTLDIELAEIGIRIEPETCTAEYPYPGRSDGRRWAHPSAREVACRDGYPGGDIATYECPHCDLRFSVELPQ